MPVFRSNELRSEKSWYSLELKTCILKIAEKRGLSIEVLSGLLGYRSSTSLKRIMNERVRSSSLFELMRRMKESLDLNAMETTALERAMLIRREGLERVQEREAFHSLLCGGSLPEADTLWIKDLMTGVTTPFIRHFSTAVDLKLHVVNCVYPAMFSAFQYLLTHTDTEVEQTILVPVQSHKNSYIMNLLMSVLHQKNYHGFTIGQKENPYDAMTEGLRGTDLLLCTWSEAGVRHSELISFHGSITLISVPLEGNGDAILTLLREMEEDRKPLIRSWPDITSLEDYVTFTRSLASLEQNTEIWDLKPDPCLCYIPADIQKAALSDGPIPEDQLSPVMDSLYKVAKSRNDSIFTKRKVTHVILKKNAMRHLALSGKTLDHFWGFRAYTREERLRIFGILLHQAMENKYFHLHFLRDDDALRDTNIMIYGGKGILICNSNTNYNLGKEHTDLLFTPPDSFLKSFQQYYMTVLVRELCLSESESAEHLTYLLNLVRENG